MARDGTLNIFLIIKHLKLLRQQYISNNVNSKTITTSFQISLFGGHTQY